MFSLQENRYIAAQLVAFLGQTPQSFTTSLVNCSGVFAKNAASFVARNQLNETTPFGAFRRSPVARRRPPSAVRPSVRPSVRPNPRGLKFRIHYGHSFPSSLRIPPSLSL
ncbi:hypothetical protein GQ457_06G026390 [Hibiscus cannabinus]